MRRCHELIAALVMLAVWAGPAGSGFAQTPRAKKLQAGADAEPKAFGAFECAALFEVEESVPTERDPSGTPTAWRLTLAVKDSLPALGQKQVVLQCRIGDGSALPDEKGARFVARFDGGRIESAAGLSRIRTGFAGDADAVWNDCRAFQSVSGPGGDTLERVNAAIAEGAVGSTFFELVRERYCGSDREKWAATFLSPAAQAAITKYVGNSLIGLRSRQHVLTRYFPVPSGADKSRRAAVASALARLFADIVADYERRKDESDPDLRGLRSVEDLLLKLVADDRIAPADLGTPLSKEFARSHDVYRSILCANMKLFKSHGPEDAEAEREVCLRLETISEWIQGARPIATSGHDADVTAVAWSADGKALVSADAGGSVVIRGAEGKVGATLKAAGALRGAAWSPDGKMVAAAGDEGVLRLWGAASETELGALAGHRGAVRSVAWSPDGKTIATAGADGTVRLWAAAGGAEPTVLRLGDKEAVGAAWPRDGRFVAAAGADGTVRLYAGGRETASWKAGDAAAALAVSPDGKLIAVGGADGRVRLYGTGGKEAATLNSPAGAVTCVAFSADGKTLAAAGDDGSVCLWAVAEAVAPHPNPPPQGGRGNLSAEPTRVIRAHAGAALTAAFSPDGKTLATGGADKLVKLWELSAGGKPEAGK